LIVLDASAAVAVLLNLGAGAPRIRERMDRADDGVHVPHLFEVEVINVLRRYALSHRFSERRGAELLEDLTTMRITRYPHTALLPRVWELRENVTAYDAAYIALAETLEAPLVTRDERLAQAPGIRATVELYE
jgi:predicted nucleic acid-binding protein